MSRSRAVLAPAGLGALCVAASLVLFALLHLLPPSAVGRWRHPSGRLRPSGPAAEAERSG